jgi:hypothetical protein
MGLAPSEVRGMTIGEIYAVMWAKTRDTEEQKKQDGNAELYEQLQAIRNRKQSDGV